jgi:hypothetical protein
MAVAIESSMPRPQGRGTFHCEPQLRRIDKQAFIVRTTTFGLNLRHDQTLTCCR